MEGSACYMSSTILGTVGVTASLIHYKQGLCAKDSDLMSKSLWPVMGTET